MANPEEMAGLDARMEQIESTMMVQSGALSSAREEAQEHRQELTRMMQDLRDTIIHQAELQKKVEGRVPEAPAVRVPPGFAGADLRVTPTKAPARPSSGDDPWAAVAGRSSSDPWANTNARERGGRQGAPHQEPRVDAQGE